MQTYQRHFLSLIALIIYSFNIVGMEEQHSKRDVACIEPFSHQPFSHQPFDHIPLYVYENCNQATRHTFTQEMLNTVKLKVQTLNKEELAAKFRDKIALVKFAELYDWIYGLHYLEEEYLAEKKSIVEQLTIEEIKKTNGKLSRLISDCAGEFRKGDICWLKHNLNFTEYVAYKFLDQKAELIIEHMTTEGFIPINLVKKQLRYFKKNPGLLVGKVENRTVTPEDINLNEVNNWLKEQKDLPGSKRNMLHIPTWIQAREHNFPPAECIEDEVTKALNKLKEMTDPIQQAAFIWWEMVRIHISHEANKRSGKALASIILLQHGYLPPLITSEDEQEYINTFIQGFDKENGFELFEQFVRKMIIKTQATFAGQEL